MAIDKDPGKTHETDHLLLLVTATPMDPLNILARAWLLKFAEAITRAPAKTMMAMAMKMLLQRLL